MVTSQKEYKVKTAESKKKGADREAATLLLLKKFTQKLETAKESTATVGEAGPQASKDEGEDDEDKVDDDSW